MRWALLDVDVLLALLDADHVDHARDTPHHDSWPCDVSVLDREVVAPPACTVRGR